MHKIKQFHINRLPLYCKAIIGNNLENELVVFVKKQKAMSQIIITDNIVKQLHGERLLELFQKAGLNTFMISFPAGEHYKNRKTKEMIEDEMFTKMVGRDSLIIALGGGVVGDVAGFVASTYMRGIPYIQVPTTTIAQSDSSYGGKTGVDVAAGKNLVGSFFQPIAVFVDGEFLKTLDKRNYVSGLVEAIKHGLIKDKKLYNLFNDNSTLLLFREGNTYDNLISEVMLRSIEVKRWVVSQDEQEANLRKILNYGHTIGHAIEKLSNFDLLHGEAISIGICAEAYLAYKQGIMSKKFFIEQKKIFDKFGLPTQIPPKISTQDILSKIKLDKKSRNNSAEFALINSIGEYARKKNGLVAFRFSEKQISTAIDEYRAFSV